MSTGNGNGLRETPNAVQEDSSPWADVDRQLLTKGRVPDRVCAFDSNTASSSSHTDPLHLRKADSTRVRVG
jgi:hypothetical protein